MMTPYGCTDFTGLGVFLGEYKGQKQFFTQGWGVGMQCKAVVFLEKQYGAVAMMNIDPGVDQTESLIGTVLRNALNIVRE